MEVVRCCEFHVEKLEEKRTLGVIPKRIARIICFVSFGGTFPVILGVIILDDYFVWNKDVLARCSLDVRH